MKKREKSIIYRRLVQSYLSSVISISLVLLLAGLTGLLAVNTKSVSEYFRENIKISILFEDSATDNQAEVVLGILQGKEYIKRATFISREEGTREMAEILGSDFLEIFEVNPIPISIDLFLKAQYLESDSLSEIEKEISSMPLVREVVYQESLVNTINNNMERAGLIIIIFIALLLFISFVLINNTIRLNLFSKRFSIHTMKLVGARRAFIRRPLLAKGFVQGLVSGFISALLLSGVVYLIQRDLPDLYKILDLNMILVVIGSVIVLGILLCVISTFFIVNRLVSMSGDDMFF
ncbi:MAG: cell division protein FtsX [Bacteroidetes bacterium HGW-Bacteroidetes-8]|jgi:cell division transport system permease protein|nr:MAG: cell division protein FtsX [Bacteroidetes bacterium HGW-Bacteroidetes-8]